MYSKRRLSRIAALLTLFTLHIRPHSAFEQAFEFSLHELPSPLKDAQYAKDIVLGVQANQSSIHELLVRYTKDHTLKKIDPVTLALLEIALFELVHAQEKPPHQVVINEAIEIAKEYGKDSSPSFINGILAQHIKTCSPHGV